MSVEKTIGQGGLVVARLISIPISVRAREMESARVPRRAWLTARVRRVCRQVRQSARQLDVIMFAKTFACAQCLV